MSLGWLVILGRTSLMPYFLDRVLVAGLAKEWFGIKLNDWWWYAFANAALMSRRPQVA